MFGLPLINMSPLLYLITLIICIIIGGIIIDRIERPCPTSQAESEIYVNVTLFPFNGKNITGTEVWLNLASNQYQNLGFNKAILSIYSFNTGAFAYTEYKSSIPLIKEKIYHLNSDQFDGEIAYFLNCSIVRGKFII